MATERAEDYNAKTAVDDIRRILGTLDEAKLLEIAALDPTVNDIGKPSLWLAGDADIFGAGLPLKGVAGEVVAILTAAEGTAEYGHLMAHYFPKTRADVFELNSYHLLCQKP